MKATRLPEERMVWTINARSCASTDGSASPMSFVPSEISVTVGLADASAGASHLFFTHCEMRVPGRASEENAMPELWTSCLSGTDKPCASESPMSKTRSLGPSGGIVEGDFFRCAMATTSPTPAAMPRPA